MDAIEEEESKGVAAIKDGADKITFTVTIL